MCSWMPLALLVILTGGAWMLDVAVNVNGRVLIFMFQ
jgi:hypothetical protein